MIRNYIKTTLRHLWGQRLFTVLNVLGLAVGISASWIIYRMVDYEFSYDKKVPDSDRVFQLVSAHLLKGEESKTSWAPKGLLPVVSNDISGVELVVPAYYRSYEAATVPFIGRGEVRRTMDRPGELMGTLPDYFAMVPYRWLAGNAATALDAPDKVVLTQSRAAQYFPGIPAQELLGKTVVYDDTLSLSVSGVVADPDYPSSFQAQEFTAIPASDWADQNWQAFNRDNLLYIKVLPGVNPEQVLGQINAINEQRNKEDFAKFQVKSWYELLPLQKKHFATEFSDHTRTVNKKVMYGLMGVAAFLILLACINYVNLSTAQMSQRTREIGIRKTLGSTPLHLISRLLGETLAITLAALTVSFLLSYLALRVFSDFVPEGMLEFGNYQRIMAFIVLLVLAVTLLAGIYPAWLVTRVQTAHVLKGQTEKAAGKVRLGLRKGLIVFQFVIAQVFIIGAIVIGQQLRYTLHKDLGFDREAVITIDIPFNIQRDKAYTGKQFVLKQELQRNPRIAKVALGDKPMEDQSNMFLFRFQSDTGKIHQPIFFKSADSDLMDLYDITLLAGRKPRQSDTTREYVINETALKAFGISSPEDAIGQRLITHADKTLPIVGVVKDFHIASFKDEIAPAAFTAESRLLRTVHIKLPPSRPGQWQKAIEDIEIAWKKTYPDVPFEYQFYDETIAALYTQERDTSKLLGAATGITIFISCLGLFGLASLTAFQRTKEIGIRKVLGASVSSIVSMLSTGFVKLVFIAILIASPIAWWATDKWLEDFAYRIDIEWWMFALAGLLAVLIALLTVSFQSIKAALMNPVKSLRSE